MNLQSRAKTHSRIPSPTVPQAFLGALLLTGLLTTGVASCGGGGSTGTGSGIPVGAVTVNPATGTLFFKDPNSGGQASSMKIALQPYWGRLVDVYDFDVATSTETLQMTDFVIGDNIKTNGIDYRLDRTAVTEKENLVILHKADTAAFEAALRNAEANVQPILDKDLNALPPFTAFPRNAAMVLPLNDLLDAATVNGDNVQILTGYSPTLPFEARVMADPNHGDLVDLDGDGTDEYYATRVLIDMTVSQIESQQFNPPLPVNSLGLPRAEVLNLPNVVMRVPTKVNAGAGQFAILRNPAGSGLSLFGNGSSDPGSPTFDVIRAFRSASAELGDPNNGFLVDEQDPLLIGVQGVNVLAVTPLGGSDIAVDFQFGTVACATAPRVGDVIELSGGIAEVTVNGTTPVGGLAQGVQMRLLVGDTLTFIPSPGQFLTTWDPSLSLTPECFLLFNPSPTQPPAGGILPTSTVTVRFSEPVDPESVKAFDSFFIQKQNVPASQFFKRKIVGQVVPSLDLREYTFVPRLPLPHMTGAQEQYDVTLISQAGGGVVDLAGNTLADDLPLVTIRMDPNGAVSRSDGLSWTFNQPDEDGDGFPELRGQFTYDLAAGRIKSRAVTRFSAVADQSQPVVAIMIPFTGAIQTPLSNFGSKMQTVWRYHDVGFSLMDDLTMNLDVESLSWAPFSGVQIDNFNSFSMSLSHSKYLPDEVINPMSLLPAVPLSGINKTYDDNPIDGLNVVHAKQNGYSLNPIDTYVSATGTQMFPWPLNRNLPQEQFTRFTWRDTLKLAVGGKSGQGVDTGILTQAGGSGMLWYTQGNVPTIGLPLLMEFRTTADTGAFGLNGFKINIALNSSARPYFRAFSTGGVLSTGVPKIVDPDNEPVATGGINPATGQPTGPGTETDNVFYIGQADFVVRVNVVHSIWFDTFQFSTKFALPTVEPAPELQPLGTSVTIDWRGATSVSQPAMAVDPKDSNSYDPYGDPLRQNSPAMPFTVTFPAGGGTWNTDPAGIDGLRFVQFRAKLISNPVTGLTPALDALGLAFSF